jgi:hypothetical protein
MKNFRSSRKLFLATGLFLAGVAFANLPFLKTSVAIAAAAFLSSVAHDSTLSGDGTSATPLGVANNGVGTAQLATNSVTGPKIAPGQLVRSFNGLTDNVVLAAGSNISINLTGNTLTIASMLGLTSVAHDTTLTGEGTNGSPLGIASDGIATSQLANAAVTAPKIASGQVVKGINDLTDNLTLAAGSNITITPSGNTLTIASNPPAQPYINPLRVATLQWYPAIRTGIGVSLGQRAYGLVFDGSHMWTAVIGGLVKFRPSDGAIVGTFPSQELGIQVMAFDGANIWVAATDDPLLFRFRASDGAFLGQSFLFGYALQVAFDGQQIWTTSGNDLCVLRPSDGTIVDTMHFGVSASVHGVAVDDRGFIWISLSNGTVLKLTNPDHEIVGTFNVGGLPGWIAFDGANMWVANPSGNYVTKLRASDGAILGTFTFGSGTFPSRITFDGSSIWVSGGGSSNWVTKLRVSDGFPLHTVANVGTNTGGLAFDGANVWVAHSTGIKKL